jgi:uncharacterized membrane protein (DUF106 family)
MGIWEAFLALPYFWLILIFSIVATLISTLVYKWVTDQKTLKEIKLEMKKLRGEQKKSMNNQKKMMEINQKMMEHNMIMMKQSFKPMIYTFLPLILLFYFMSSKLAYMPIMPNEPFTITAQIAEEYPEAMTSINITSTPALSISRNESYASSQKGTKAVQWIVQADKEGTYNLLLEGKTFKQSKEILVSNIDEKKYAAVLTEYKDSQLKKIIIGNKEVKTYFGLNWIWTYIILSVLISMGLRKAMDIA